MNFTFKVSFFFFILVQERIFSGGTKGFENRSNVQLVPKNTPCIYNYPVCPRDCRPRRAHQAARAEAFPSLSNFQLSENLFVHV